MTITDATTASPEVGTFIQTGTYETNYHDVG